MPIKETDRILGPPRGSASEVMTFARRVGSKRLDDLADYLATVYDLAPKVGIDPAIVVSQSALETDNWRDKWFSERLNPAGISVTGDPAQNAASPTYTSGTDSARAQIVHLWLYLQGWPLHPAIEPYAELDPRRNAIPARNLGAVVTLADLGGRWAVVTDYGQRIANRADDIFPNLLDQRPADDSAGNGTGKEPVMGMKAHRFVGLDADVWLPDDIEVDIRIIEHPRFNSRQHFTGQRFSTWHDTGNPDTNAEGEYRWAAGGRQGGSVGGYSFIYDADQIIQTQQLDRVTWAQGTPNGNRLSWAAEQAFGGGQDFQKTLEVGIALHAGLIAAMGWKVDTSLVQHNYWTGKACPGQIRRKGLWPEVQRRVAEQVRVIKSGGADPTDGVIDVGDTVAATANLNIRDQATTDSAVLATIPAGGEAVVSGAFVKGDTYNWLPVTSTVDGKAYEGFVATAYVVLTKDKEVTPDPVQPEYATPVAIPELAPYIGQQQTSLPHRIDLADGTMAFAVYDRVRAVRDTRRRRFAEGDADVGDIIRGPHGDTPGEEFDVSFLLVKPGAFDDTYVSPFFTRIRADDVVIISDEPKDIEPAAEAA